jgi:hypothetical protein
MKHRYFSGSLSAICLLVSLQGQLWSQEGGEVKLSGRFRHIAIIVLNVLISYPVKFYYRNSWFIKDSVVSFLMEGRWKNPFRKYFPANPIHTDNQ